MTTSEAPQARIYLLWDGDSLISIHKTPKGAEAAREAYVVKSRAEMSDDPPGRWESYYSNHVLVSWSPLLD